MEFAKTKMVIYVVVTLSSNDRFKKVEYKRKQVGGASRSIHLFYFTLSRIIMVNVAISAALALTGYLATTTLAGFPDTPSVVQYWGQNSGGGQQPLATYCDDSTDALLMSFVNNFNIGSLPDLNLASSCKGSNFPNTNLLDCPQVSSGKLIKDYHSTMH